MKKIAVLVSGEYRTFKYCRPTMTFLDGDNVDVYFSTWDVTVYESTMISYRRTETVTRDTIINDLGFVPKDILIESSSAMIKRKYNCKMIHRWVTGYQLIKKSGVEYDQIIITRPDLYFLEIPTPFTYYENELGIAWYWPNDIRKLADTLMISSPKIMDIIIGELSVDHWARTVVGTDWHSWFYEYCYNKSVTTTHAVDFVKCTFYRGIVPENTNDFDIIGQYECDWRDLRLLYHCNIVGRHNTLAHWSEEIISEAEQKWASGYFDKYRQNGKDNP